MPEIGFGLVAFAHLYPAVVTHLVDVATLVFANRIAVIHPQERTDLHLVARFAQLRDTVGGDQHDLARPDEIVGFVTEVWDCAAFGRDGVTVAALADDDRRAAVFVACGDDAAFGEDQHRAGAFDLAENVFDAFGEGLAFGDQHRDEFGLVRDAVAVLAKMVAFGQQFPLERGQVGDLGHRYDGEFAQVAVHDDRLCVCIADYANSRKHNAY